MKYTKKALTEKAETIRRAISKDAELQAKLEKDQGRSLPEFTEAELFMIGVSVETGRFDDRLKAESMTEEEERAALAPVKAALGVYHDCKRWEYLDKLAAMKDAEAVKAYLADQTVDSVEYAKKDGAYSLTETKVSLDAWDVVNTVFGADKGGIIDACCIFADNLVKMSFHDCKAGVTFTGLSEGYLSLRNRMGWTLPDEKVKNGARSAMIKQLDELVKRMFRVETNAEGKPLKMIGADLKYLEQAIIQTGDKANKAGAFIKKEEKTVVNRVFRAMFTRYNGLAYEFQDQTNYAKAPQTVEKNKQMDEGKRNETGAAVVGDTKVEVA